MATWALIIVMAWGVTTVRGYTKAECEAMAKDYIEQGISARCFEYSP